MTPAIAISATARQALVDAEATTIRMRISERFEYTLSVEPADADDVVVDCDGIQVILDAASATRADGTTVDYVGGPSSGFTIQNARRPTVRQMSALELEALLKSTTPCLLIDVRTDSERDLACIAGSRLLDQACHDALMATDRDALIVFQCHHGIRSQSAAEYFLQHGFTNLHNLVGGIDAWSQVVDPRVPRY